MAMPRALSLVNTLVALRAKLICKQTPRLCNRLKSLFLIYELGPEDILEFI
jgi:hypothetical protein